MTMFRNVSFGFSTLLQKHCNKKQETQKCILKLCGWKSPQGTYTPLWGVRLVQAERLQLLPLTLYSSRNWFIYWYSSVNRPLYKMVAFLIAWGRLMSL